METIGFVFGLFAFVFAMYNLDEIRKLKEKVRGLEEGEENTEF